MENSKKIMFDTNIILDFLCRREPFNENAILLFNLVKQNVIKGFISAHSFNNIWFITRKEFDAKTQRNFLLALFEIFEVVSLDSKKILTALEREEVADFEDCLQDECAAEEELDYIVTRNKKDFAASKVPAVTPEELLKLINKA